MKLEKNSVANQKEKKEKKRKKENDMK